MGTAIVITSGKGGTGKTACTAALGSALSMQGKSVCCVDCDVGLRNLDLALGLTDTVWDFGDVLEGRIPLEEALTAHPRLPGLSFLPAPGETAATDAEKFRALIDALREKFDFVLLDSPAGLGSGFRMAAAAADTAVLVANPDASSMRDGERAGALLRELGVKSLRLLINRVQPKLLKSSGMTLDDTIDVVGVQLIGVISEDESVPLALAEGEALMLYGARTAFGQFMRTARRLCGERTPLGRL